MNAIEVGQVYQDRDYANAAYIWGEEDQHGSRPCLGIQMRQIKVVEIGPEYVKVVQVKGKRPGAETWMKLSRLQGRSRSQGFDLVVL